MMKALHLRSGKNEEVLQVLIRRLKQWLEQDPHRVKSLAVSAYPGERKHLVYMGGDNEVNTNITAWEKGHLMTDVHDNHREGEHSSFV